MMLWSAFLIGLLGSLHCAGMCGPLALALPVTGKSHASFVAGRVAYNLGRVLTYAALGAVFGLLGRTLAVAGIARWVSMISGALILVGLLATARSSLNGLIARFSAWIRTRLSGFFSRPTFGATLLFGMFNGLLPCGLVYAACAVAVTAGGTLSGVAYMAVFGLGTIPMLLGVGLMGRKLQFALRSKFQKFIPLTLALVAVLLIVRGLALGIPYLSPDFRGACPACH